MNSFFRRRRSGPGSSTTTPSDDTQRAEPVRTEAQQSAPTEGVPRRPRHVDVPQPRPFDSGGQQRRFDNNGPAPRRYEAGPTPQRRVDGGAPQQRRFDSNPQPQRRSDGPQRPRPFDRFGDGSASRSADSAAPQRRGDSGPAPRRFDNNSSRKPRQFNDGPRRDDGPRRFEEARVIEAPLPISTVTPADASAFAELGLSPELVRAVGEQGYSEPTPVQRAVLPDAIAGRDVLACAQTGTGKTAAFLLPILQSLAAETRGYQIRALVLTPTRELAAQIVEHAAIYGRHLKLRHTVIYGGVSQQRQERALKAGPDLLVATPGRLLDLIEQGLVRLDGVTKFVLDEADRMLDMGFVHDVRRIASLLPEKRQTLLFSATIPQAIDTLSRQMLKNPVRVAIEPKVTTAETIEQSVVFVAREQKRATLVRMLADKTVERALVFTRTKHGASRLSDQLQKAGIGSEAIHGNKSQGQRDRALASFKRGTTRVLVATDVAARGIDVDGVSHVINFEIPDVPETYVHRIGRTGRAGASGQAISFCDGDERRLLAAVERLIRRRLPETEIAMTPSPVPIVAEAALIVEPS